MAAKLGIVVSMSTFGISFYSLQCWIACVKGVGWGPLVELTVRSSCFVSISASSQYSELDCEENKLEVRMFDKQ